MNCLIVEDDPAISDLVRDALTGNGLSVETEANGDHALDRLLTEAYDVAVVDIMLPGRDGISLVRKLRTDGVTIPILMLTARRTVGERVEGLDAGADDYLGKPFHIDELVARVKALARRARPETLTVLAYAGLSLNLGTREVRREGRRIELSNREFSLLEYLLRRKERVLSRGQICQHVWGYYVEVNPNLVDVYVKRLREKIEDPALPPLLQTIRGVGYCLRKEPA
ncbi:MAG: response regulator transcription factor [Opitutales bacterium]|nr:response regulator transcription factor [Opitutales bacterium]